MGNYLGSSSKEADSLETDLSISPFDASITAKINAINDIFVGHLGGVSVSARKRRLSDGSPDDSSPKVSRMSGSSDILSSLGLREETPPAKRQKGTTFTSLSSYIRKRRSRVPSPKQEKKAAKNENVYKPTPFLQATRLGQPQKAK